MLCGIGIVTFISGLNHYSNLLKNVQEKRKEKTRNKRVEIPFSPLYYFHIQARYTFWSHT